MNESITKWSQKEFKAYLLLYAANSNQNVTDEEKEFIESKFDKLTLKKMSKELELDNDYQRLQKILKCINQFNCTDSDIDKLLEEVKFISTTDGTIDVVEQSTYSFLTKMLKN
jgi:hypothetical protein